MVHNFCFIELHSFDLIGISLHLPPITASKSLPAPVGAGKPFLWERCTFHLGKDTLFIYLSPPCIWQRHKMWWERTQAGASTDGQNKALQSQDALEGGELPAVANAAEMQVKGGRLRHATPYVNGPCMSVKHGELRRWRAKGGGGGREEKRHTGQCILMSIKKQHHDRKRFIKPWSCDGVTNSKDRAIPPPLGAALLPVLSAFSPSPSIQLRLLLFPPSMLLLSMSSPSATPWPPCAL